MWHQFFDTSLVLLLFASFKYDISHRGRLLQINRCTIIWTSPHSQFACTYPSIVPYFQNCFLNRLITLSRCLTVFETVCLLLYFPGDNLSSTGCLLSSFRHFSLDVHRLFSSFLMRLKKLYRFVEKSSIIKRLSIGILFYPLNFASDSSVDIWWSYSYYQRK